MLLHTACTGLTGLPRAKATAPAVPAVPRGMSMAVAPPTLCVQPMESFDAALSNCAKQPPRSLDATGGTSWSPDIWKTKSDDAATLCRLRNVQVTISPACRRTVAVRAAGLPLLSPSSHVTSVRL